MQKENAFPWRSDLLRTRTCTRLNAASYACIRRLNHLLFRLNARTTCRSFVLGLLLSGMHGTMHAQVPLTELDKAQSTMLKQDLKLADDAYREKRYGEALQQYEQLIARYGNSIVFLTPAAYAAFYQKEYAAAERYSSSILTGRYLESKTPITPEERQKIDILRMNILKGMELDETIAAQRRQVYGRFRIESGFSFVSAPLVVNKYTEYFRNNVGIPPGIYEQSTAIGSGSGLGYADLGMEYWPLWHAIFGFGGRADCALAYLPFADGSSSLLQYSFGALAILSAHDFPLALTFELSWGSRSLGYETQTDDDVFGVYSAHENGTATYSYSTLGCGMRYQWNNRQAGIEVAIKYQTPDIVVEYGNGAATLHPEESFVIYGLSLWMDNSIKVLAEFGTSYPAAGEWQYPVRESMNLYSGKYYRVGLSYPVDLSYRY